MAIEFTATNGQGIQFGAISDINNLVSKSISLWFYIDTFTFNHTLLDKYVSDNGWSVLLNLISGTVRIQFYQRFSTSFPAWYINSQPSTNTWHNLVITYNNSSTTNDPIFYIDGSVAASTEYVTPTGTVSAESGNLEIGFDSAFSNSTIDGKIKDIRIYNRILTQSEVTTLATSSNINKHVVQDGLVFWCPCVGTAGVTAFDGVTLSASNKILDVIGENEGTPVGSPKGSVTIDLWGGHAADSFSSAVPSVAQKFYLNDDGAFTNTQIVVGADTDDTTIHKDYIQYPSLTKTERDALSPSNGTVVWNEDDNQLQVYYNSTWRSITMSTGAV